MSKQDPFAALGFQADPFAALGFKADKAAVLAVQAAKFPTAAEGGNLEAVSPFMPDANTPMNVARGLGRAAMNLGTMPYQLVHAATHPVQDIVTPMQNEADKARAELNAVHPDTVAAFGHLLASIIPGIGPWAASLGERAKNGDTAGALAEAGAMLAAPHLVKAVIPAPETLQSGAANLRGPIPKYGAGSLAADLGTSAAGYALGGPAGGLAVQAINLARRSPAVRGAVASGLEGASKVIDVMKNKQTPPTSLAIDESTRTPINIQPGEAPLNRTRVAEDEAARMASIEPVSKAPLTSESVNVTRPPRDPKVQEFLDYLNAQRVPELSKKTVTPSAGEIPMENPPAPAEAPAPKFETAPLINKWLGVPTKEVLHGANPGLQLVKDGLVGATKAETLANIQPALESAGKEMDSALKASDAKINMEQSVLDAVTKVTKRIGAPRDAAFQAQMQGILDDISTRYPNLTDLSPRQVQSLKIEVGDAIHWHGALSDAPANQALMQIYRDANSAIKESVGGIAELQERWGNYYIASKSLKGSMAANIVGKGTPTVAPAVPRGFKPVGNAAPSKNTFRMPL